MEDSASTVEKHSICCNADAPFVQLETSDMLVPATRTTYQAHQADLCSAADPVAASSSTSSELPVAEVLPRDDPISQERFASALSSYSCGATLDVDCQGLRRIVVAREAPGQQPLGSTNRSGSGEVDDAIVASYARPEYIFCKLIKSKPDAPLGITFRSHQIRTRTVDSTDEEKGSASTCCVVSQIARDGPLGDWSLHYVRPGDIVLSVNGNSTAGLDAPQIAALLRESRDSVSLTVHNPQGDPRTVASTVQKPAPHSRIGICLVSNLSGTKLKVGKVHRDSLFADSLLVPGHRCLEINGQTCKCMLATGAVECLRQRSLVTIVTRAPAAQQDRAVVLCCEQPPKKQLTSWWKGCILGARSKPQRAQPLDTLLRQ